MSVNTIMTQRTHITVSIDAHKKLIAYAKENGQSATLIASRAIIEFLYMLGKGYTSAEELIQQMERVTAIGRRGVNR